MDPGYSGLQSSIDPYIETKLDWLSIIIICAIVGSILVFFVLPLMMFACFKSRQRRVEKVERREMLAQSLRASRDSLAASRALRASRESLDSLGGAGIEPAKRRRPPLDESTTFSDSADKSKFALGGGGYFGGGRPAFSPQTSADYSSTRWDDDSTYWDDDDDDPDAGAVPLVENEIATVPARAAAMRPSPAAAAYPPAYSYRDDDASVAQSLMGSNFRRQQRQRPRPAPSYDSPSAAGLGAVDEAGSVTGAGGGGWGGGGGGGGGRPPSDASSVATSEGRSRPPRPRLR